MAKKIYANVNVSNKTTASDKNIITDINGLLPDSTGNINYPFYDKEYIDKIIKVLPVSRVGTMNYLPMNVNGSFEGAVNYIGKGIYPVILENDGTLVYLRPGTNGSTFNYYYCYQPNIRTSATITPVLTNEKYVPNFFTQNHKLISFIGSNSADVLMMNTNNGTINTYTVSLTNGTMNSTAHQSVEFPSTMITDTNPQYVMVHNNIIYIWCIDGYTQTSEFAISLYTMNVSDVKSGIYTSLSKVSGFSGTNLYGDAVSGSPNIKLTNMYFSQNLSNKPLYTIPPGNVYTSMAPYPGNTEGSLQAVGNGDNIRVAFFHSCSAATQQQTLFSMTGISFVYNISTKKYTLDTTAKAPVTITTNSSGIITYDHPFYVDPVGSLFGMVVTSTLNKVPSFYITGDGLNLVTFSRHDSAPEHFASKAKIRNFTSLYDSWNLTSRYIDNNVLSPIYPIYGSAIGDNLIHPTLISKDKLLLCCSGTYNGSYFGYNSTVYTELSSTRDYQYNSVVTGNTINGFVPNADRKLLDNSDYKYSNMITIVDENGDTKVYGSSFFEGLTAKYSGALLNQNTLSYDERYTLSSSSILTTLKQEMLVEAAGSIPYSTLDSRIILFYIPDGTYTKSYAVVTGITSAPTGTVNTYILLSEVDVTINSSTITAVSILSTRYIQRNIRAAGLNNSLPQRQPGLIIAKYSDFTYVGIPTLFGIATSSTNLTSLICKVDNSTKLIYGTPKYISTSYNSSTNGSYQVGVLPNIGFGLYENGDITDIKTKLVFKLFGTTEAQFDAMVANPASNPLERIVVAAEDVAEGFIVYFTQEVPVLINGSFYKLPPTSIDLNTITPSPENKTFYIYVVVVENVCKYLISTEKLSEEFTRTYIGTVVTGALSISTIESEKVTRFLTNRVSTTKRGSAIPVSTGVPSGTGSRWK